MRRFDDRHRSINRSSSPPVTPVQDHALDQAAVARRRTQNLLVSFDAVNMVPVLEHGGDAAQARQQEHGASDSSARDAPACEQCFRRSGLPGWQSPFLFCSAACWKVQRQRDSGGPREDVLWQPDPEPESESEGEPVSEPEDEPVSEPPPGANAPPLEVGAAVAMAVWDADVPADAVGEVVEILEDGYIVARFPQGEWEFPADDLVSAESQEIRERLEVETLLGDRTTEAITLADRKALVECRPSEVQGGSAEILPENQNVASLSAPGRPGLELHFPDDLVPFIMSHLGDPRAICRAALVSKAWRTFSVQCVWRNRCIQDVCIYCLICV